MTENETAMFAADRGMTPEMHQTYLENSARHVLESAEQTPDLEIRLDPDVCDFMESSGLAQEVTAREMAEHGLSVTDAMLHEIGEVE